ncbi:AraC family transcriptional regulator, partial [Bittarella massiliensis]|nr:AraC family transcriptional regulator [Bittarella massiliensis (ex Durand et al. 2017)]
LYRFEGYEYNLKRISAVLHQINEQAKTNISELSETACLSSKQFTRIFLDYVGATPKEFLRIVRMQRALFKV